MIPQKLSERDKHRATLIKETDFLILKIMLVHLPGVALSCSDDSSFFQRVLINSKYLLIAGPARWYFNEPFLIDQLLLCQGRLSCLVRVAGNVDVQRLSTVLG